MGLGSAIAVGVGEGVGVAAASPQAAAMNAMALTAARVAAILPVLSSVAKRPFWIV